MHPLLWAGCGRASGASVCGTISRLSVFTRCIELLGDIEMASLAPVSTGHVNPLERARQCSAPMTVKNQIVALAVILVASVALNIALFVGVIYLGVRCLHA